MISSYLIAGINMTLDAEDIAFHEMLKGYEVERTEPQMTVRMEVRDKIEPIGDIDIKKNKMLVSCSHGYTHAYYYDDNNEIYGTLTYNDRYEDCEVLLARESGLAIDYIDVGYLLLGALFNYKLTYYNGICLHGSAIRYKDSAIIFTAPSGVGKSTQAKLWHKHFGDKVSTINDDKPALRMIDGKLFCFGTPFAGKEHLNRNDFAPVKAIINVMRGDVDSIVPMTNRESIVLLFEETARSFLNNDINYNNIDIIGEIIATTPFYRLFCTPTDEAVKVAYDAICEVL